MTELKKAVQCAGLKFRKPKNPGQTWWDRQYDNMESVRLYKVGITKLTMINIEWENRVLMLLNGNF